MKNASTFSILFWVNLSRSKNGKARIYARITVNGKRSTVSLNKKVLISNWDAHKNRARGSSQQARILNSYLDETHSHIFKCYRELKIEQKIITAQTVKSRYLGNDEDNYSLMDIIKYHNQDMDGKLKWGTHKNYYTTQKYISKFIIKRYKTSDVYLKALDFDFIIKFEKFLRGYIPKDHQKKMDNNTVMKHIERLRKQIHLAIKLGWISQDPFINFKSKYIRNEREFLSKTELERIEQKQFDIERLALVKDLFIFSCYTSLSYIDVINLNFSNIQKGIDDDLWIYYKREKTSKTIKIPLLPKALEMIEKYYPYKFSNSQDKIFPKISNQKLNSYLKEIADLCSIHKNITFHMARHTFATTVTLSNGLPIETVSKLLGHSKISTTQIYARIIDSKISKDM